jgi:hypothetical protein
MAMVLDLLSGAALDSCSVLSDVVATVSVLATDSLGTQVLTRPVRRHPTGAEELVNGDARVRPEDPVDLRVQDLLLFGVVVLQQDEQFATRGAQHALVDVIAKRPVQRVQDRPHLGVLAEHHQDRPGHPRRAQRGKEELLFDVDVPAQLRHGSLEASSHLGARGWEVGAPLDGIVDLTMLSLQGLAQ